MNRFFIQIAIIIIVALLAGCGTGSNNNNDEKNKEVSGKITLEGSRVVLPLAARWAGEFNRQFPKIALVIKPTTSLKGIKYVKSGAISMAMSSVPNGENSPSAGLFTAAIAMDVVLPVISFDNDNIQNIVRHGLTREKLSGVFSGKIKTWGELVGSDSKEKIEVFRLEDSSGTHVSWAGFLSLSPAHFTGTALYDSREMVRLVSENKNAIGYASSSAIFDPATKLKKRNIYVAPVDFDSSGIANDNELVYDKLTDLKQAVTSGKYPLPPARYLYLVMKAPPQDAASREFIKWVLTVGQNYCEPLGFFHLDDKTRSETLKIIQ